jgi:NAD+ synthase
MSGKIGSPKYWGINLNLIESRISEAFISAGKSTAILGVSGGLDSAIVAATLAKSKVVKTIHLIHFSEISTTFKKVKELYTELRAINPGVVLHLAETPFKRDFKLYDEQPDGGEFVEAVLPSNPVAAVNLTVRTRMAFLYHIARLYDGLVVGTTNLSEYFTGYFTKWGDSRADVEPIIGIPKSVLIEWMRHRNVEADGFIPLPGVPSSIVMSTPSADLWEGQTDEGELGMSYEDLDKEIFSYIFCVLNKSQIVMDGLSKIPMEDLPRTLRLFKNSTHKRISLNTPKIIDIVNDLSRKFSCVS